jgi:hypothetical protein
MHSQPHQYGQQSTQQPPQAVGTPAPTSNPNSYPAYTPGTETSSLGFASPVGYSMPAQNDGFAQNNFAGPVPAPEPEIHVAPEPAPASSDPALMSMNVLSGQQQSLLAGNNAADGSKSMADQAYAKLVNMDAFDLVKDRGEEARYNPFEAPSKNSVSSQVPLADLKKNVRISSRVLHASTMISTQ